MDKWFFLSLCGFSLFLFNITYSLEPKHASKEKFSAEEDDDVCPFPWQSHDFNIISSFAMCSEFQEDGVRCTPNDPIECTGRNPMCIFSKKSRSYRCCSDHPQDISNPPGNPEQVKPICPYGASSYDLPSVLLCDPSEKRPCPDGYSCEEAINSQMLSTYNMHLCCKTTTLDSFENVFYETKVGINKYSDNLSMPVFYVTSLSPSIIPNAPQAGIDYVWITAFPNSAERIFAFEGPAPGDQDGRLLQQIAVQIPRAGVLEKSHPHGNPEAMNLYYNRPTTLSREIELTIPNWDEGAFFRTINRVLTITNDKITTKQSKFILYPCLYKVQHGARRLYIVLVFKTKKPITRRNPVTYQDFNANYTSFTEFLSSDTGKFLGTPVAGSYFYVN
ncbi:hypothetical protein FO519_007500 [Halicephalobus sp. NKZ332]|nr:hypothetical protein FO519_007500 [Halicephalobus sp. NKZ332]